MWRGGIFGPSLCGKTTLARALSQEYWRKYQMRSLVLDLNNEAWGEQALVMTDEKRFWPTVWNAQSCLVIVEEATETINRNGELTGVFTRLRHKQHRLLVSGHSGVNLLPIMREQIDTLYLFRQTPKAAKMWAEDFVDETLLKAPQLKQYEFLHAIRWQTTSVKKLRL